MWKDVAQVLEKTIASLAPPAATGISQDWSINSVRNAILQGVKLPESSYTNLINLDNTCYLNAQLQCVYHILNLR